jgi:hypothetical protein
MSEEEFLARWSRRKREASSGTPERTDPMEAHDPTPPRAVEDPSNRGVDLSSLPPIESIDAVTDITAFLRKGIPQELSRAALRRAWSADPAIRDFVGLAENAWDFNDPNAMPGFGPLDCSEAQLSELIERVIGGVSQAAESLANPPTESKDERERADSEGHPAPKSVEAIADVRSTDAATVEGSPQVLAASQPEGPQEADPDQTLVGRRTHGGALPR